MRRNTLHSLSTLMAGVGLLALVSCSSGGDAKTLGPVPTTAAPTTVAPATSTSVAQTGTTRPPTPTSTRRLTSSTAPSTTLIATVVATGTTRGGAWQLVAEPGSRSGLVCAVLRGPFDFGGQVCNEASEQDFNGNDTLRYSGAGDGTFIIGVSRPTVATVRMELGDGTVVERATAEASFTAAARFVALPLPENSVLRSLTAVDARGAVLTRIMVNP